MTRLRVDRLCTDVGTVRRGDGATLVGRCYRAADRRSRLVGLLATNDLASDEGIWLEPCSSVHTFGMRIPIACVFIDADGHVLRVVRSLRPWRAASARGAAAVLEALPGTVATLRPGDTLVWGGAV
jgi:uncharacterized membrane protein (UPF0127 family)